MSVEQTFSVNRQAVGFELPCAVHINLSSRPHPKIRHLGNAPPARIPCGRGHTTALIKQSMLYWLCISTEKIVKRPDCPRSNQLGPSVNPFLHHIRHGTTKLTKTCTFENTTKDTQVVTPEVCWGKQRSWSPSRTIIQSIARNLGFPPTVTH